MTDKIMSINGVTCYEEDGTAYLRLEDVARGLGFTETHGGKEYVRWLTVEKYLRSIGFSQKVEKDGYIPENVFYRLAMKANNETAEKFQALVADKIIPSIRKNGGYIAGQEEMTPAEIMAKAVLLAQKTIADRDARIAALTEENAVLVPKGEYFDELVDVNSLMNFTDTAKALGVKRKKMLDTLTDEKYLYRQGSYGKLIPYEKNNHGYFEVKEQKNAFGSWAGPQTFVTVAGRQLLLQMRDEGYFD